MSIYTLPWLLPKLCLLQLLRGQFEENTTLDYPLLQPLDSAQKGHQVMALVGQGLGVPISPPSRHHHSIIFFKFHHFMSITPYLTFIVVFLVFFFLVTAELGCVSSCVSPSLNWP